jgi:hypothetical protein
VHEITNKFFKLIKLENSRMRNLQKTILIIIIFYNISSFSQVGIGTVTPHQSSILDVSSTSKGVLIPRLTTAERDAIVNPSNGLLLYNVSTSDFNFYNNEWKSFSPNFKSINATSIITTNSLTNEAITGMILEPSTGLHSVTFESEISNTDVSIPIYVNSNTILSDFFALYNEIQAYSPIDSSHSATFGSGETIFPGRYDIASAVSSSGNLTLNGQGNPDAIFIIHAGGALNFAASSTITMTNGASSENVFWVSQGAIGVGADSIIFGNLISPGAAIAIGANCSVTGRLLSNIGAVSFGPGICSVNSDLVSVFNFGSLNTLTVFTGSGAINNTGSSVYNGNICTGSGALSGFTTATVNGIVIPPSQETNINQFDDESYIATFGIYQNDIIIPSSSKNVTCNSGYTNISLSGIANIIDGEIITIKWKTNSGTLTLGNRVLTSIKVNN